ncbi:hypothetical protein TRFO_01153 [Tritrichomonas foetus]|uniref:Protein kinase domain-containing protein n=1 Tax=Tritrichomonas foetus TaxID=1144522 RepID=A0A1J4KP61_9EUKA|nr:hypothetical protein TRFO_01153 [Tritrichomonas foetus]|eukprot:OHT11213.1 hypothetical protein TRFO_01153 [Tritrichomonas foetus]
MIGIDHPALAKISFIDQTESEIVIATELPKNGTLEKILSDNHPLTATQRSNIALGIAAGLHQIHNMKMVHGDLCPKNILIDENYHPKIAGYGMAPFLRDFIKLPDVRYMSPEIMDSRDFGQQSDIYSLCMILIFLFSGQRPYSNLRSDAQVAFKISKGSRPEIPDLIPIKYKKLIERGITEKEGIRLSISEIVDYMLNDNRYRYEGTEAEAFLRYKETVFTPEQLDTIYGEKLHRETQRGDTRATYEYGVWLLGKERNEEASKYIKDAAEAGYAPAQNKYGEILEKGIGVPIDEAKSKECFRLSSIAKDPNGLFNYGRIHKKSDEPKAKKKFKEAADLGHMLAQYKYACLLQRGKVVLHSNTQSAIYFKKAADQGHPRAQYFYAVMNEFGRGVEKNTTTAAQYFQMAIDNNVVPAMNHLGHLYEKGNGVPQDYAKAFTLYKQAADQEHVESIYNLACLYNNGNGTAKDQKKALELFKKASDITSSKKYPNGYPFAQFNYALLMEQTDLSKSVEYYHKAADNNFAPAQYSYGYMLRKGIGAEVNIKESEKYVLKSADNGYPPGQYVAGKNLMNHRDYAGALRYFELASKQAKPHAKAAYEAGKMLWKGNKEGVSQDQKRAVPFFKISSEGKQYKAMAIYGTILDDGKLVGRDRDTAMNCFKESAESGEKHGQYYYGLNIKATDVNLALKNFKASADQGYLESIYEYGKLCRETKKYDEALKYFTLGANREHMMCRFCKSLMLYYGEGCKEDKETAIKDMKNSADQGYSKAMVYYGQFVYDSKYDDAVAYFKKAADLEDEEGCYFYGLEVEKRDKIEAYRLFSISASKEYDNGRYKAGFMAAHGYGTDRNYEVAIDHLTRATEKGHIDAMIELGRIYQFGRGTKISHEKALDLYKKAADKESELGKGYYNSLKLLDGDNGSLNAVKNSSLPICKYSYAIHLLNSDKKKAAQLLEEAANEKFPDALGKLGSLKESQSMLQKGADLDDPVAQCELGRIKIRGADQSTAFNLLKNSAEQNYPDGQYYYAKFNKKTDIKKQYYKLAADNGHYGAQREIAALLISDDTKHEEAVEYYKKAAAGHDRKALNALGFIYLKEGNVDKAKECFHGNVKRKDLVAMNEYAKLLDDKDDALELFVQAAAEIPEAMYLAGSIYEENDEKEKAREMYQKAVDFDYIDAYYGLGKIIEKDDKDIPKAKRLYEKAVEKEHSLASYRLGKIYYKEQNEEEARKCFEIAEKSNDKKAIYYLGKIYIETDQKKGFEKLKTSANFKYAKAMFETGLCYKDGKGTRKNQENALLLLSKAANSKHKIYIPASYEYACMLTKDVEKQKKYFQKAADAGHNEARIEYAKLLIAEGKNQEASHYLKLAIEETPNTDIMLLYADTTDDANEKKRVLQAVANEGNGKAMMKLADVIEDNAEKLRLLKDAGEHGENEGKMNYALALINGTLCKQDAEKGKQLLQELADAGYAPARKKLRSLP